jgi:hypothetical protein
VYAILRFAAIFLGSDHVMPLDNVYKATVAVQEGVSEEHLLGSFQVSGYDIYVMDGRETLGGGRRRAARRWPVRRVCAMACAAMPGCAGLGVAVRRL